MSLGSVVARGRASAESRMESRWRFFHITGRGAVNPATGIQTPTTADIATDVPGRIHASGESGNARTSRPAEALGTNLTRVLSIPVDSSTDIKAGVYCTPTTLGPLDDPALDGIRFRVVDPGQASQATARRLRIEVDL